MSDLPPPTPTPPSIEEAVREHIDVVHQMLEFRRELRGVAATVHRLVEAQTVDRLTLGRVEKKLDLLLKHLGVRDA